MKKLLLFTCLLGFSNLRSQTNVYHPFPTDTAFWILATETQGCIMSPPCPYERTVQMGDTLINSLTYKKIYSQWGTFGPPGNCGGMGSSCFTPYSGFNYKFALRQDSAAKKMYIFPNAWPNYDTLLYDFNLNVGDTLAKSYINSGNGGYQWVVQKIDSVLIEGKYNKAFIFDTANSTIFSYLIEGVGSSHGLLNISWCLSGCEGLCCFNNDPIPNTICQSSSVICGNYAVADIKQNGLAAQLSILPNPSYGIFKVTCSETIQEIKINNLIGERIGNYEFAKKAGGETQIDISTFENGIYFIQINTMKGTLTRKVILNK